MGGQGTRQALTHAVVTFVPSRLCCWRCRAGLPCAYARADSKIAHPSSNRFLWRCGYGLWVVAAGVCPSELGFRLPLGRDHGSTCTNGQAKCALRFCARARERKSAKSHVAGRGGAGGGGPKTALSTDRDGYK